MKDLELLRQEMKDLQDRQLELAKTLENLENKELLSAFEIVKKAVEDDYDFRKDDYGDDPDEVEAQILKDRESCLAILEWHMTNIKGNLGIIDYSGFDITTPSKTMEQIQERLKKHKVNMQYERYIGTSQFLVTLAGPSGIFVIFGGKEKGLVRLAYDRDKDIEFTSIPQLVQILEENKDNKGWR